MGIIDTLLKASDAIETVGKVAKLAFPTTLDRIYEVHIDDVNIFDMNPVITQAGNGRHSLLKSEPLKKKFSLSYEGGTTGRYVIRLDLLTMLKNTLSCKKISKKNIHLEDAANYLTFEGYAKNKWGKWIITNNIKQATNYVAYKLTFFDCTDGKKEKVEHDTLYSLFIETIGADEYQSPSDPL